MAEPTDLAAPAGDHPTIIFDGVCNLCTVGVRFIISRDPRARFRFASAQSETGRRLLRLHLGDGQGVHLRSTAALRIAARLTWPWCWARVLLGVPAVLRDPVYRLVAATRYRVFGRREVCWVPTPALAERFLP